MRVFKAVDLNPVRATAFADFRLKGEGTDPLPAFYEKYQATQEGIK
jgi:hypothetical protein